MLTGNVTSAPRETDGKGGRTDDWDDRDGARDKPWFPEEIE